MYATDFVNGFEYMFTLPEEVVGGVDTYYAGSKPYLAGQYTVDTETLTTYFNHPAIGDRFLTLDDDTTYVRVTGGSATFTGGTILLDQSREIFWPNGEGGPLVNFRVVEPSPPTHPLDWFFIEVDRALEDYNATS
jgi:hypothetical protein